MKSKSKRFAVVVVVTFEGEKGDTSTDWNQVFCRFHKLKFLTFKDFTVHFHLGLIKYVHIFIRVEI